MKGLGGGMGETRINRVGGRWAWKRNIWKNEWEEICVSVQELSGRSLNWGKELMLKKWGREKHKLNSRMR